MSFIRSLSWRRDRVLVLVWVIVAAVACLPPGAKNLDPPGGLLPRLLPDEIMPDVGVIDRYDWEPNYY